MPSIIINFIIWLGKSARKGTDSGLAVATAHYMLNNHFLHVWRVFQAFIKLQLATRCAQRRCIRVGMTLPSACSTVATTVLNWLANDTELCADPTVSLWLSAVSRRQAKQGWVTGEWTLVPPGGQTLDWKVSRWLWSTVKNPDLRTPCKACSSLKYFWASSRPSSS